MHRKSGKKQRKYDSTSGNAIVSLALLALLAGRLSAWEAVAVLGMVVVLAAMQRR